MAILFMGSLLSGAFSGLIAAGILDGMAGVMGLPSWYVAASRRAEIGSLMTLGAGSSFWKESPPLLWL